MGLGAAGVLDLGRASQKGLGNRHFSRILTAWEDHPTTGTPPRTLPTTSRRSSPPSRARPTHISETPTTNAALETGDRTLGDRGGGGALTRSASDKEVGITWTACSSSVFHG